MRLSYNTSELSAASFQSYKTVENDFEDAIDYNDGQSGCQKIEETNKLQTKQELVDLK